MSPSTNDHEVVPYRERRSKLPVEKCKDHPKKNLIMFCKNCQIPICPKCEKKYHEKHTFNDLEKIYSERFNFYLSEIYKIRHYFLPASKNLQRVIKKDAEEIKSVMVNMRASVRA